LSKKKTKRPKPEVGQTVYVTISSILGGEWNNIYDYIVTKVNTSSFYAHNKDNEHLIRRFDLKTFTHKGSIDYYYAHLTKEEILKSRAIRKEKNELKHYINNNLKRPLPLLALKAIKEIIDNHNMK